MMQYAGEQPQELVYIGDDRFMRRTRTTPITFSQEEGKTLFHFELAGGEKQTHEPLLEDERLPREVLMAAPYEKALEAYRSLVKMAPKEPALSERYLNRQGLDLLRSGQSQAAIAILRIATDLYPDSANTWDSLGYAFRETGDKKKAVRSYKKALQRDAKFPSALLALEQLKRE
jgi:tetratricopeptide (TPR) repeat protein